MNFTPENMYDAMPIMAYGMLGVFVVTLAIIGIVWVLNALTSKKG